MAARLNFAPPSPLPLIKKQPGRHGIPSSAFAAEGIFI